MRIETREDAVMLREVLAPIWAEYYRTAGAPDTVSSTNMCCRTATMVAEIDPRWRVVHGTLSGHAHAWSERADGTILDLTADQFGDLPVVWGEIPETYLPDDRISDTDCPGCSAVLDPLATEGTR